MTKGKYNNKLGLKIWYPNKKTLFTCNITSASNKQKYDCFCKCAWTWLVRCHKPRMLKCEIYILNHIFENLYFLTVFFFQFSHFYPVLSSSPLSSILFLNLKVIFLIDMSCIWQDRWVGILLHIKVDRCGTISSCPLRNKHKRTSDFYICKCYSKYHLRKYISAAN